MVGREVSKAVRIAYIPPLPTYRLSHLPAYAPTAFFVLLSAVVDTPCRQTRHVFPVKSLSHSNFAFLEHLAFLLRC